MSSVPDTNLHPLAESAGVIAYDYIITGAGCSGLSMLMRMLNDKYFANKKILLVEKESNQHRQQTWCYWETEPGFFEELVFRKWHKIRFSGKGYSRESALAPYSYKMIRGIDFFKFCYTQIKKAPNVDILIGTITHLESNTPFASFQLNGKKYQAAYIFNSILFEKPVLKKKEYLLLQHFKGWIIETSEPAFDPLTPTLMDFNCSQQYGTAFFYTMPFSPTRALIEYTFFTKELLEEEVYNQGLKAYIGKLMGNISYEIIEEEKGCIPMTNHLFPAYQGNIINIGTAGGQTKGSSGYSFQFIQKRVSSIIQALTNNQPPFSKKDLACNRFHFYDSVLLHLLFNGKMGGDTIFTQLFQHNELPLLFKFLDNESNFLQDLKIIRHLPVAAFSKAAIRQLMG